MQTAIRYHDISCGHRVVGHLGKCVGFHGHNYRIHFHCMAQGLDLLGRVMDFFEIKTRLCDWLESNWDHRFLLWERDPVWQVLDTVDIMDDLVRPDWRAAQAAFLAVPFNPTAERMAQYLLHNIGPTLLDGTGITLYKVRVDETRRCSAEEEL